MVDGDPERYSTRAFAAEAFSFVVHSESRQLHDAVQELFSDLSDGREPVEEFSIVRSASGFRLFGPEPWPTDEGHRDGDTILNELVTAVNRKRLDAGADRLHLHAGIVANDEAAVLIAGSSGMGKTTLVTSLARRGWVYLTDEAGSIALGDPTVRAFPKPVTVKYPGTALFPDLAPYRVSIDDGDDGPWHVPLGRAGVRTATAANPTLVVLLTRSGRPEPSWEPVRPADVVVALVEQTMDFERYGDDALLALAELCASRRCVHVDSGDPEGTARLVEELAAERDVDELTVARLHPAPGGSIVSQDVVAVAIGDEAVLGHRGTGQVISLNPAAARLWRTLASEGFESDALGPEHAPFVQQLTALGYVQDPDGMVGADVH